MIVEFDTYPVGKSSGLGEEIAKVKKIIEASGLDHQLTAMGTIIEGDWDEVMGTIKKCHHRLKQDHERVETHTQIERFSFVWKILFGPETNFASKNWSSTQMSYKTWPKSFYLNKIWAAKLV